jgi:hypothetical protein
LVWTMLPRIKASALVLLLLTSAIACLLLAVPETGNAPLRAEIADGWYTVNINVTVTDEIGRPIRDAFVGVRDNTSMSWLTDSDGNSMITGLADNVSSYTLWANKSGYLNSQDTIADVNANQTTNLTLVITGATIWGMVTSPLGEVIDATVSIPSIGYSSNVNSSDGTYSIGGVPSGTYPSVVASAPDYTSNESVNFSVTAGKTVRLDFTIYLPTGSISGYVLHDVSQARLSDLNVSASAGNLTYTDNNVIDGLYVIPGLPEGNYTVTATKDGFYPSTLVNIVVVKEYPTTNVNFSLSEKPTKIYGTVKSGIYLQPQVNVSVVGTTFFNISDVEGYYSLENLSAGTYTISAQLEGYVLALVQDVVLPIGGQIKVDIELAAMPGAIVRGEVLEKDTGNPLLYVTVTIIGPDGKQRIKDTNFRGQFEFTGLAEGNYTLQFEANGYWPLEVSRIEVRSDTISNETYFLTPEKKGFTGFIFGFDLAHSMMILALFVTIMILAAAVYLRIRTFQAPENAPAVYDQAEEEEKAEDKEDKDASDLSSAGEIKEKRVRKKKEGGS